MPTDVAPSTHYLPAGRSPPATLAAEASLAAASQAGIFFDAYPVCTLLLDARRQIIYANRAFLELAEACPEEALGRRPGEALGCLRCESGPDGCGTSIFCRSCGAARSLEASLAGRAAAEECLISRSLPGRQAEPLELLVWTSPIRLGEGDFILMSARDLSQQKRREALERVFYHDLANTAMAVDGLAALLEEDEGEEAARHRRLLRSAALQLVEEIASQRALKEAEEGRLVASRQPVEGLAVLGEALEAYDFYLRGRQATAAIDPASEPIVLDTDPALLRRVLVNMIKNAIEAAVPGETIRLRLTRARRPAGDRAVFTVRNSSLIPEEARSRVFQRSFSTKGRGRGLGTYGMKLLGERYLGGMVCFSSEEGEGTIFRLELPLE